MEFRILGPLEVLDDGRPLDLGRLKERAVLAVLLLHANEFVSRERLIDELWGPAPPPTARKAVNVYISKLRKTLSANGDDPIATSDGGYRLVVDPELVDAGRVRRLVATAREQMAEGDSEGAARVLEDALALWRGPTLAGLQLESLGRDEVVELDELRLTARMDRIDCDLALGRHARALSEVNLLVREHPLRERLRAQQMLALYRADRQVDALDAYQQARRALIDELGIEPSESLQRLQQAILRHDSALELPAGTAAANGAPIVLPRRRRNARRRRYLALAALAVAAAVAVPVAVLTTGGSGHRRASGPLSYVQPDSFAVIDPATGKILWDGGAGNARAMAVGRRMLWVVGRGGSLNVGQYDLQARKGLPPFGTGHAFPPFAIAADSDREAWVSEGKPFVTWIVPPAAGTGTPTVPLETKDIRIPLPAAAAEAVGGGYLWVIAGPLASDDRVALVGVRSHAVAKIVSLGRQATAIAYGDGAAWVGTYDRRRSTAWLSAVGPDGHPQSLQLETNDGAGPLAIATGSGSVWVLTSAGTLVRVDARARRIVDRIALPAQQPDRLAVAPGAIWIANHTDFSLSKLDPRTHKVLRTIPLGTYTSIPCALAATRDAVFVAIGEATCDT